MAERKIIQITERSHAILVLCNDGTLWSLEPVEESERPKWAYRPFPPIPQPVIG